MQNETSDALVKASAVARRFGVTTQTVLAWTRSGRIPHLNIGPPLRRPVYRFKLSDIEAAFGVKPP